MEKNQYSETALRTACYRAYHVLHDEPKIFDDFLASSLLTGEELTSHEEQMVAVFKSSVPEFAANFPDDSALLSFMMQAMAAPAITFSRACYAEDRLEEALGSGVEQYV
ncbi:MAG TPA: class I SAM-dependent methyltransferase, partial [Syntrophomonadaceae bacterium]|nr:class I SAM-dependent methyltransferase [Syntrophomonadaceae bacterium]